ncbi:hypothetical protein HFO51_06515 [Rhizobium leguminosarum]|uniref:hypothetical protein n=1 Tax=Rhizobium leguminosarum TaxID=384 RepID=UPI001C960EC0|nr:hypothetical protein [Rhizobium leguminosarum]MBY5594121.1 hypothetical protein [Rhizobium leguminosarum]
MNSYTDESGFDGVVPAHPLECEGPTAPELAIGRTPQSKAQMLAGDILEQLDLSRGHMERTRIARMIEKFYPGQPDELEAMVGAEWQPIATAPDASDAIEPEDCIWVIGGRYKKPTLTLPDGEWWRVATQQGLITNAPTHWQPQLIPAELSAAQRGEGR